jgi:hypothetical protein
LNQGDATAVVTGLQRGRFCRGKAPLLERADKPIELPSVRTHIN